MAGKARCAPADQHGHQVEVAFIHQPGGEGMLGERRATHRDVMVRRRTQLPDGVGVEGARDARPARRCGFKRRGVHDLVGGLPNLREVPHER